MKLRRRWICLGACATMALLAMPAVALAKPGFEIQRPGLKLEMSARGSHGYRITIKSLGPRFVLLSASKGDVSADYAVRGRATRDRLDANFGDLGRVSVRFHGSPHPYGGPLSPSKCNSGRAPIYETGSFDGTIRFRGEHGFTSATLGHAHGTVLHSFRRVCEQPAWMPTKPKAGTGQANPEATPTTVLLAASTNAGRRTFLDYVTGAVPATDKSSEAAVALAFAEVSERRGGVEINRRAFVKDKGESLLFGPTGSTPPSATLSLRSPFSGTASYSETAEGLVDWTGSLTVSLPGAPQTPLAGSGFKAKLCTTKSFKELESCVQNIAPEPEPSSSRAFDRRYGSGSQSQAFWDVKLSWSR